MIDETDVGGIEAKHVFRIAQHDYLADMVEILQDVAQFSHCLEEEWERAFVLDAVGV